MTRILILGGAGMLGHKMFQILGQQFPETYATVNSPSSRERLERIGLFDSQRVVENVDVTAPGRLERLFSELTPDVVVNCVGIIKQRYMATNEIASIEINSLLPHRLAEMCDSTGAWLVHFSTDCVFDGVRGSYTEDDVSNATDLYGRTKFLGEVQGTSALTLRSSIIGRELANYDSLLEWFLNQNHRKVKGFKKALYAGITTSSMASLIAGLIEDRARLTGLYQVSGPWINKYDLLHIIREKFDLDIEIEPDEEVAIDRSLVGDRFNGETGYCSPSWLEMIEQLASDPTPYRRTQT